MNPPPVSRSLSSDPVFVNVVFFSGEGKMSNLIRWRTWGSGPAHVGLLTTDGKNIYHSRPGKGVRIDPLLESCRPGTRIDILQIALPPDLVNQFWALAESQLGKKYDWRGNLGFISRRQIHHREKWFCSEIVSWLFFAIGHPLLHRLPSWKYSPEDLWRSPLLHPLTSFMLDLNEHGKMAVLPLASETLLRAADGVLGKPAPIYANTGDNQNAEKCRANFGHPIDFIFNTILNEAEL